MSKHSAGAPRPSKYFRSVLSGEPCRHPHKRFLEARNCGYSRERKAGVYGFTVIDPAGETLDHDAGLLRDEQIDNAQREARQAERDAEIKRLRQEEYQRQIGEWWNPYRPRRD